MTASLDTALSQRNPNQPLLFHSGRGSQYTSVAFRQFLDTYNIVEIAENTPFLLINKS